MSIVRHPHGLPMLLAGAALVWLGTVDSGNATPLPSPVAIELTNPSQRGDAGDVLTFSGVLRNLTADSLFIEGWGLATDPGNTSGYPVRFSFTPQWYAWPKAVAFRPHEVTPLMPLFTAAIAADFHRSRRIRGAFAVAVYPLGSSIYNPDGTLTYENANGPFTIEIGEPPFPEPVPEPATFVLSALGGLVLFYRRRRAASAAP